MKIKFITLITVLLVNSLLSLSCSNNSKPAKDKKNKESGAIPKQTDLPRLAFTDLNNSRIWTNKLEGKIILILYQPQCDDCQREAKQISENLKAFEDYSIYFISNATLPVQAKFAEDYKLSGIKNVHFGESTIDEIINALGPIPAPSLFIYSPQGKLVKSFKGETDIQQIISHL